MGIIHCVLKNKESQRITPQLAHFDETPFDFTYMNYIFISIQLAGRIWLQKDVCIFMVCQCTYDSYDCFFFSYYSVRITVYTSSHVCNLESWL